MKKVSVVGRWPLCTALTVGGLLMLAPQAHAQNGQWVKKETEVGSDSQSATHEDEWVAYANGYPSHPESGTTTLWKDYRNSAPTYPFEVRGTAGYNHLDGKFRTWFEWEPTAGDPNNKVPDKLSLLIIASGEALAADGGILGPATTPNSDPRMGDYQHYLHTPGNEKVTLNIGGQSVTAFADAGSTSARLSKRELKQISTGGDSRVPGPWFSFSAHADLSGERFDVPYTTYDPNYKYAVSGSVRTSATYLAQIDSRSISIGSGSLEPSYFRTMDTSQPQSKYRNQTPPQPFYAPMIAEVAAGLLHERGVDGAMTADSVAVRQNGLWQVRGAGFFLNTPGGWNNPTYAWSVSGESTPAYGYDTPENQPYSSLILGLNLGNSSQGFPKSSTVTLTVTDDQDGAVGKNTYDVKWHLPYEKTKDLPDGLQRKEIIWISNNPVTPLGGSLSVTEVKQKPFDAAAMIDDVLVVAGGFGVPTEPFSELVEVFQALTNITKWGESEKTIQVTGTQISHTEGAFDGTLGQHPDNIEGMTVEERDTLQAAKDYSSWKKYDCYGGYVRLHHEKSLLADQYDVHGFNSSNHRFKHDVTERYEFENFYQLKGSAPNPPASSGDREVPPSYNLS